MHISILSTTFHSKTSKCTICGIDYRPDAFVIHESLKRDNTKENNEIKNLK